MTNYRSILCVARLFGVAAVALALQSVSQAAIVYGTYGTASGTTSSLAAPRGNGEVTVNLTINSVNYGNHAVSGGGSFNWSSFNYTPDNVDTATDEYGALTFLDTDLGTSGTQIITFCLELTETISLNNANYSGLNVQSIQLAPDSSGGVPLNNLGNPAGHLIEELWKSHFLADAMTAGNITLDLNGDSTPETVTTQAQRAGAFQLAIWKLEYDGGAVGNRNLATGNLKVLAGDLNDTTTKIAQSWLNALTDNGTGARAKLVALSKVGFQDQITEVSATLNEVIVVPEPASLATWSLLGLLGLAYRRRRRAAA